MKTASWWKSAVATVFAAAAVAPWSASLAAEGLYGDAFEARYGQFDSVDALDGFAASAVKAGQYDQAISTLEQLVFDDPNDVESRIALARLYYHVGSFDLARGHAEEALALASGYPDFETALRLLLAQIDKKLSRTTAFLDVTAGLSYGGVHRRAGPGGFPAAASYRGLGGLVLLEGGVSHELDNASRDFFSVTGHGDVVHDLADPDFDATYVPTTLAAGGVRATFSKGLPEVVDTLRFDLTGLGEIAQLGAGRIKREVGVEARLSVRPTVESVVYIQGGYSWLGGSTGFYTKDRWTAEAGAALRLAPGWTLSGRVSGYWDRIVSPYQIGFAFPPVFTFDGRGIEGRVALEHLLHAFDDGRTWTHEISLTGTQETTIDYGKISVPFPFATDRLDISTWAIGWDHTVQTGTHGAVKLGVKYGQEYAQPYFGAFKGQPEQRDIWGVKLSYTHRFQ